jgi:hypothetical protein
MTPPFAIRPPRLPAVTLVLLVHLGFLALLLRASLRPEAEVQVARVQLVRQAPSAPKLAARQEIKLGAVIQDRVPLAPLPSSASPASPEAAVAPEPTPVAEPIRPLDLRLPAPVQASAAPSLHDRIRADPRANSPLDSAEQRMVNALGGRGWTVLALADGGHKVTGPFGECFISRKSQMIAIEPDNPRWTGLRDKVFSCGGIEKGSLKHERPK